MKKMMQWVLAATLLCGTMNLLTSCCNANQQDELKEVRTTELVRTSQSWDGVALPDYLQGKPEIVGMKYEIPAGQKLGMHFHPVMNFGILVQGDLTIISEEGLEKVVHEGETVVEMVGTVHHGENRGTKPVILYMFYLSQEGLPLSVQQPETPQESDLYQCQGVARGRDILIQKVLCAQLDKAGRRTVGTGKPFALRHPAVHN